MSRKLYINGQVADIDINTKVGLSYKSPLFCDILTVTANTTMTIKIPKTAHNRRLIDNVNVVGVLSNFAYDHFRVDYIEKGFDLIKSGKGHLLNVSSEDIEISVTFGGSTQKFAKMKDVKLNQMPIPYDGGFVNWKGATWTAPGDIAGVRYIDMQYSGNMTEKDFRYVHPCVSVRQVIDWIQQAYGVQIWIFDGILNNWVLPCVTKDRRAGQTGDKVYTYIMNIAVPIVGYLSFSFQPGFDIKFDDDAEMTFGMDHLCLLVSGNEVFRPAKDIKIVEICEDGSKVVHAHDEDDMGSRITVNVVRTSRYSIQHAVSHLPPYIERLISARLTITPSKDELVYGWDKFDVLNNLPDINVLDFIKAVSNMMAMFPVPDKDTPERVQFLSLKTLYETTAKDWSQKLLKVKSVEHRYGELAQSNTIHWAEDNAVKVVDVGEVKCENKTLSATQKLVELPFAACDESGLDKGRASLGLYEKITEKVKNWQNEYIYVLKSVNLLKIKPRIVHDTITAPRMGKVIRITGSDGLMAKNYELYRKVMRKPVVVKAILMLTPRDISELDMMIPVYIEQLQGCFALMSVNVKEGESEVELLKLT